jgi:glutamate---cysteine ligase / carboxylate-amine ligase
MKHAFGSGEPYTVGIEEELFLVDPDTHELVHDAERIVAEMGLPAELGGHEAPASQVELRCRPNASASAAVDELARGRTAVRDAGATLMGGGLHPTAPRDEVRLVESERYRKVHAQMRGLILRAAEAALHVHVGMPDPESALRSFNGLRGWLPLLRGLAASSPFWFGRDSGLASARWALIRPYPGRGIPRPLHDFDEYEQALSDSRLGGGPDDYTMIWWDVRLHPTFGTIEVREMDAQSRLSDVAALAALVQGLAHHHAETAGDPVPTDAIEWSAFRAARDGLEAEILLGDRLVPLPKAARAAVELAVPHARESGSDEALRGIERILENGNGADRQRAAFDAGGMAAVLELLVGETAARL